MSSNVSQLNCFDVNYLQYQYMYMYLFCAKCGVKLAFQMKIALTCVVFTCKVNLVNILYYCSELP